MLVHGQLTEPAPGLRGAASASGWLLRAYDGVVGGRGRARAIAAELAELPHAAVASAAEANPAALKILRIAVSPPQEKDLPAVRNHGSPGSFVHFRRTFRTRRRQVPVIGMYYRHVLAQQ